MEFKIKLLEHTPNPDKLVTQAAKLCYSASTIDEIGESLTNEKIQKFLTMLTSNNHESPIEHVSFTFAIEGVSRIFEQQLTRHRLASYSIQSGRYVNREQLEYYTPKEISKYNDVLDEYIKTMNFLENQYVKITTKLIKHYVAEEFNIKDINILMLKIDDLRTNNKKKYSQLEKKAIENARYIYPQGMATRIIVTMNARQLLHFFNERCCTRAQDEIRDVAFTMLKECKKVSPVLFKNAGAKCIRNGFCPEGTMSCGIMPTINQLKNDK